MRQKSHLPGGVNRSGMTGVFLLLASLAAWSQQASPQNGQPEATNTAIQELQQQVRELRTVVEQMRSEAADSRAESAALRRDMQALRDQLATAGASASAPSPAAPPPAVAATSSNAGEAPAQPVEDRLARLEESSQLMGAKVDEQYQTKIESAAKYRVRLSGMVLLNLFSNRGSTDNQDFPSYALVPATYSTNANVGASMRQSEIGLEVFGPRLAGARTSGSVQADFAGGFPDTSNGVTSGLFRLRTASMRLDWRNTSIVAGQDNLFLSPYSPTSFASLAIPAFSYAGNLWGWIPQVRVEHRFDLNEANTLTIQTGLLDNLTGEPPYADQGRIPLAGEMSGQPGYGGRVSWTGRILGQPFNLGSAGYYSSQNWGFDRRVTGWAEMLDWEIPLTSFAELSGEFYRGNALGGLGGGMGRSVLFSGDPLDAATRVRGLNSIGGWAQLKIKVAPKLELNGAFGLDNPFAEDLKAFPASQSYLDPDLSRNLGSMVNFVYRPRSNLLFSTEYRRLLTSRIDEENYPAGQFDLMMGVLF